MNGSPLFTGDAGSGESEIRRWLLEKDYVESIIALPEQLFYNTGISTYVWVLTTRKAQERRGQVQLIDASDVWEPMRKSLGDKRRRITDAQVGEIVDLYHANEESERVQVFPNEAFGFRKIRVERPLRLNVQASEERIKRLWEERAFEKLAKSRKKDPEARRKAIEEGKYKQEQTIKMLQEMAPTLSRDYNAFRDRLKKEIKKRGLGLRKPVRTAILSALSEKDEEAEIVRDTKGRIEPDSDLRDYESVPLTEDVEAYFEREVKPHVPDAYIDEDYTDDQDGEVGRVGYEINFNRYFYTYEPPRPLHEIESDIREVEQEIVRMIREVTA
jgi:type I restriction enzyme M protein